MHNRERGFTLVETLVSMAVLTMGIIPALALSNNAVSVAFVIRDDLIAAGLAQEGIEVVQAIRDDNWLNNRPFDTGLSDGDYQLEWDSTSLSTFSGGPLKVDNGLYNYSSGTASPFTRDIIITKVNDGELKVVSRITWQTRTNDAKTTSAEEHLFNWK